MIKNTEIKTAFGKVTVYSINAPTVVKSTEEGKANRIVFTSTNWFYRNGAIVVRQAEVV